MCIAGVLFGRFFGKSSQLELAFFEFFLDFDLSFFLNLAWILSFFTKIPSSFSFQFTVIKAIMKSDQKLDGSVSHCKSKEIFDICFVISIDFPTFNIE